ncbi:MAG: hypothetical protein WD824_17095 [Cyclobacteriaceae bacterium]
MKTLLALALTLTGIPSSLFSQSLSPGYIVTVRQDTIRGFILDGIDSELGLKVDFS